MRHAQGTQAARREARRLWPCHRVATLPASLDELPSFLQATGDVVRDLPVLAFLRAASADPAAAAAVLDVAAVLPALQLARGDDSGLGSDDECAPATVRSPLLSPRYPSSCRGWPQLAMASPCRSRASPTRGWASLPHVSFVLAS